MQRCARAIKTLTTYIRQWKYILNVNTCLPVKVNTYITRVIGHISDLLEVKNL